MVRHWRSVLVLLSVVACGGEGPTPPPPPVPPPPPPPAPTQLVIVVGPGTTLAGEPITPPVEVELRDAAGAPVTTATGTVAISLGANPGGAALTGAMTAAAVAGKATFPNLRLDQRGAGYTLVASATSLTSATSAPFRVVAPMTLDAISPGGEFTCGIDRGGVVQCWGNNRSGELGDGTTTARPLPSPIAIPDPQPQFVSLSAGGNHVCAVTTSGTAYCWGANVGGTLGDGTEVDARLAPVPVSGGLTFARLSAGSTHTCGLTTFPSELYCWGNNNAGQLGDGTQSARTVPVRVAGALSFVSASVGGNHTCGVTTDGTAYCWGANHRGQLGIGSTSDLATPPTAVAGDIEFTAVSTGSVHSCGVTGNGEAYCWGNNFYGQLGDGTETNRTVPTRVGGGVLFAGISAGAEHTCGLATDQMVYCWGKNFEGQLGLGGATGNSNLPQRVVGVADAWQVGAGLQHGCVLRFTEPLTSCWGANTSGQLGDGSTVNSATPRPVVY